MKIWMHEYELKPQEPKLKPRRGALLKVEWAQGQVGYSDLHPWPEFGEPTLGEHLADLSELRLTPLVDRSLEFNYQDRELRLSRRNAFLGMVLPRSHRLVFDMEVLEEAQLHEWHREGFTHVKVKMGRNFKSEGELLIHMAYATKLLWRIDFNGRIGEAEFRRWWVQLGPAIKARIDFVEDPTDGTQLNLPGPWANDWKIQKGADIRIVKPARESDEDLALYNRVVFTHSMDHVLGQAASLWVAGRYYMRHPKRTEVCGLAATDFFLPDEFSQQWSCRGPRMKPTSGTGFGFDELIQDLRWDRLV